MWAILKKHIFVGVVDGTFSLVQHDTKLLLVRHADLWYVCVYVYVCVYE